MSMPTFNLLGLTSVEDPWGPNSYIPESLTFNGVPYAPFIKSDRLGKIADWQAPKEDEASNNYASNNAYSAQRKRDLYHAYGASAAKLFSAETEEKGFNLVDSAAPSTSSAAPKQAILRSNRRQPNNASNLKKPMGSQPGLKKASTSSPASNAKKQTSKWGDNKWNANKWNQEETNLQEASITVEENWKSVAEIEFNKLSKLNFEIKKPELLTRAGSIHNYSRKYEAPGLVALEPCIKVSYDQTTSKDRNMQEYASKSEAQIFITDAIIAQLMCTPKSNNSWDVIITKKNGKIFFDKRDGTFDLPVNEHSTPLDASEASILQLESTEVSNYFLNGALGERSTNLGGNSPVTASAAIPKGYAYYKYHLPNSDASSEDKGHSLIVRSSLDAFTTTSTTNVAIHSLLQIKSNDWKTKFKNGVQGNMFADEIKKNNNKISQWTTQAVLANINQMKIGFIARDNMKNAKSHSVAGLMSYPVDVLSQQLKLSVSNGWGIFKSLIDLVEHEGGDDDYRFVIFKTPNAQKLVIYKVPFDSFDF